MRYELVFIHSYLLTFASRSKHSFHTFMKLCSTQIKNTNTVSLLITSTHTFMWLLLWFPEQDRYRVRALHHPSAIFNVINLLSRERERERERERYRHNKQNETSTGAIQRQDYRWHTHTITRSCSYITHTSPSDKRYTGSTNLDHVRQGDIAARSRARRDTNTFLDA